MTEAVADGELRIWALLGARAGDNDQVLALARAIGRPFTLKPLEYNGLHRLGPRLLGQSLASLTSGSREAVLSEPPPDLTISTGHRSVPVVRALHRRSGGRMRAIHVGFPRMSPAHFDLVVVPPQYAAPDHPNLLRIPFALTQAAIAADRGERSPALDELPRPRRLLIVGGPTLFWDLDERKLLQVLTDLLSQATAEGGAVMVTTSPRTPAALTDNIGKALVSSPVPTLLARPRQPPSYASVLEAADTLHITSDSVSMVSDAIWTRKPLALVPVMESALGRRAFALNDRLRSGRRLYPQDLRFFWRALAEIGIGPELAVPRTSPAAVMEAVLDRVRPVLAAAEAAALY